MMLYAIVGEDVPNSLEQRLASRPAHLARLVELEAAQAWAEADPYVAAGVYARVTVRPFRQVFPRS